eukprot:gnl/TRDRNA2_/TRDRNA2_174991_c4_seq19.p1 gnl/TRDRNA2_/TRDRNA2_174991_c4~~gnl/TRDRNA2_/TRDRNA2_174991_c4_seq19.p1  ORF type:complete len:129 (+),score=8.51 gnl/TRDRNA2_/TRDRNA2_174991_c4_seq19:186-572(+)
MHYCEGPCQNGELLRVHVAHQPLYVSRQCRESFSSEWLNVAHAHAVFARSCALNSVSCRPADTASTQNTFSSEQSTFASAHTVLTRLCAFDAITCRSAALANAASNLSSDSPGFANVHSMFAKHCASH